MLSFGRSLSDKFIQVLESPQVTSLISSGEYEKSGKTYSIKLPHLNPGIANFFARINTVGLIYLFISLFTVRD